MTRNEYKVFKKSAGYSIKAFGSFESAKAYAEKCCKANHNRDYSVFVWEGGRFVEIH